MLMPSDPRPRYWHAGGSIVGFGGLYLPDDRARDLQDFYVDLAFTEAPAVAAVCARFARELAEAIRAARAWASAARGAA